MAIQNWPKTSTSSDWGAVDGITFSEGQAANTVNDSARAMGRDLAKWRDDLNSSLTTGGSANAYTLASNASYGSLANGFQVAFKASFSNTGAATLNVDSLGAKALRKFTDSGEAALAANDIVSGGHYWVQYNTTVNSAAGGWVVLNPSTVGTVANASLATMATLTVKANVTGGTATPTDVAIAALLDTVGSTRGTLYYRGASDLDPLAVGSVGQVLRSDGTDPGWVGGMTLLNSGTASGASVLDITLPTGYRAYKLVLGPGFVVNTASSLLAMRVSYDGGSTFQTTNYSWGLIYTSSGPSSATGGFSCNDAGTWTSTAYVLSAYGQNTSQTGSSSYIVDILQGTGTSFLPTIHINSLILNAAGSVNGFSVGGGNHNTADVYDAIRILSSSGTISGKWFLYGVA